jgi:hypothetical protein
LHAYRKHQVVQQQLSAARRPTILCCMHRVTLAGSFPLYCSKQLPFFTVGHRADSMQVSCVIEHACCVGRTYCRRSHVCCQRRQGGVRQPTHVASERVQVRTGSTRLLLALIAGNVCRRFPTQYGLEVDVALAGDSIWCLRRRCRQPERRMQHTDGYSQHCNLCTPDGAGDADRMLVASLTSW